MKKTVCIIAIILVIILGMVIAKIVTKDENATMTSIKESESILENDIENIVENNTENNEIIDENEQNELPEKTVKETKEDTMTDEEKAKAIVKKDWGEDNTVYFENEKNTGLGNGKFEITVRNKKTTNILYRYTVDINTGEFTYEVEAH